MSYDWYGLNRTWCDCCEDMRVILKQSNVVTWPAHIKLLGSLVEELQVYGNRMEASLSDETDLARLHTKIKAAKKTLKKLDKENDNG